MDRTNVWSQLYGEDSPAFDLFLEHTDQKVVWAGRIATRLLSGRSAWMQSFSILDVGAGDGGLVELVIARLGCHIPKSVTLNAVDPSAAMLARCRARFTAKQAAGTCHLQTFVGRFPLKKGSPVLGLPPHDLVVASHVFFWVPDWPRTVRQIMRLIAPSGSGCLIMLSARPDPSAFEFRQEIVSLASSGKATLENAVAMESVLRDLGVGFSVEQAVTGLEIPAGMIDDGAEPLMNASRLSDKGRLLVEFLARRPWSLIPEDAREGIVALLRRELDGSWLRLRFPEEALWIEN